LKYYLSYALILVFALLQLSCKQVKLSDARDQYVNGLYYKASESYRKLYSESHGKNEAIRGIISFEMAESYRKLGRSARALSAYRSAIRYKYPDTLMYLHYAKMLHKEGEYELAIEAYDEFLKLSPGNILGINGKKGVEQAKEWKENPKRYKIEKLDVFNSGGSEYSPFLSQNGEVIYFTSSGKEATGEEKNPVTGTKYSDLFISRKNYRGEWQKHELLNPDINSAFDESTPSITKDGRYLFYTASYSDREQLTRPEIYISRRINGLWTKGVPFEINNIDSTAIFAHPSISPSGRYLYFVSDMRGGYGGKDIWRARLSSSFKVDTVENMGPIINSSGDELYPYVRDDNSIYFSSDGHPGMGGLDIFEAYYNDKMNEWIVENIKSPINSSQDDFGITFEPKVEKGYFSSNRNDVRGYHHIYSFEYLPARIIIEGFAVDQDDEFISGATVSVVGSDGFQSNFITSSDGVYKFEAEKDKTYLLMASADGFLNQKKMLHTANLESDTTYYVDFEMIPYNKPVILDNVFYDLNSAKLRPESKSALDELIALLNEHPEISIELTAHTDRLGDEGYNINLSANRAKSVVDYLVQNGIDQYRLKAKGCGKSAPKVINRIIAETYDFLKTGDILNEEFIGRLTPEQQKLSDQLNRRTEFRVLNPE
jgi:peptidoglycan-associated lipoprotein